VGCGGVRGRGFWHGRGREGKRARDEMCRQESLRGSEDGSGAREGEPVAEGARGQGSNRSWPGGGGAGGARAPCKMRAIASGSETTSRTRMRPPHFRQRVMPCAKTRARSFAQPMRRGLGEDVGEDSAGSKSSASCGGGGGAAGFGMTRSRRRWWLAKGYASHCTSFAFSALTLRSCRILDRPFFFRSAGASGPGGSKRWLGLSV
jgi:hypothetical protein